MSKVGRNIADFRKRSGMSQMSLADRLSISYQAVSNWERGETMPDISKLPQLAHIFDVSIDEILDESKGTQLLKNLLNHTTQNYLQNQEVSLKDISEIAPLLSAEQVQEIIEHAEANMNIGNLMFVAPYVSEEFMNQLVKQVVVIESIGAAEMLAIAPYISQDMLDECATKLFQLGGNGVAQLAAIAPYLSQDVIDVCSQKLFSAGNGGVADLLAISSFMSKSAIDACAKEIIEREGKGKLVFMASIMSENAIDEYEK
ncbi:helix-turn-helix domain-containing protein [Bacillus sp. FJAT-28004]|uniref:helix-turn-helix domain-containing protein n=1 Tax=Bacillus sp. FJAT-28004 TaxID=1679165 RepID=UPI0019101D5A|nr:helix-turn-helix transcriptional regulator [Bacillus sp. FJAT-28004]